MIFIITEQQAEYVGRGRGGLRGHGVLMHAPGAHPLIWPRHQHARGVESCSPLHAGHAMAAPSEGVSAGF